MLYRRTILAGVLLVLLQLAGFSQPLKRVSLKKAGFDPVKLTLVDRVIEQSIADNEIPGAVLAVVRNGKMAYLKAYGNKSVYPQVEPMTTDVLFDLASCSKPMGTATAIMQMIEQGRLRLSDPVTRYLPRFAPYVDSITGKETPLRVIDLLTHTSGLPASFNADSVVARFGSHNPKGLIDSIALTPRKFKPGCGFLYSCLNFITLQHIVEAITGTRFCDYASQHLFAPLGLTHTAYCPQGELLARVAPTEKQPDGSVLRGAVHDPLARLLNNGNSGNAGLFSCAEDMAIFATAMMNGGAYRGKRILGKRTVEVMITVPRGLESFGRSLGWDNYSPFASCQGDLFTASVSYGHTGYTGTSLVIDPATHTAVILLAHRVHPTDKGSATRLRALVANIVAGAIVR